MKGCAPRLFSLLPSLCPCLSLALHRTRLRELPGSVLLFFLSAPFPFHAPLESNRSCAWCLFLCGQFGSFSMHMPFLGLPRLVTCICLGCGPSSVIVFAERVSVWLLFFFVGGGVSPSGILFLVGAQPSGQPDTWDTVRTRTLHRLSTRVPAAR